MSESFQVGEVAILQNIHCHPERNGLEVEIIALPQSKDWVFLGKGIDAGNYVTRRAGDPQIYRQNPPYNLRKKRPPPKREDVGEWDLCPWQPAKERA